MRTTVNIDDELMKTAQKLTGIEEKAALLRAGLQALIEQESARLWTVDRKLHNVAVQLGLAHTG
jgi:Arc/MetJ family transcription regulator